MSDVFDKYQVTQYSVSSVLAFIEADMIAIPEIQRPFVWKPKQVRDLIDSLYNGYPTGYLIIWQNPEVKLKNGGSAVGKKVLIDGQQRVTALMAAIGGKSILNDEFDEIQIKIAFNPLAVDESERFEVQTPIHLKSKNWIPDISEIFKNNFNMFKFMGTYLANNPEADQDVVNNALTQLLAIKSSLLGAIELVPKLDINEVTEIFVRINSQGKRLNESDFAMSKIAADEKYGGNMLRKAIDYFCHLAVSPQFYPHIAKYDKLFMASEFEPKLRWVKDENDEIYDPDYNDMLRVSFMHKFGRAKLGDLVSLLSGRDFIDRKFKEEIAEESFSKLKSGILNFMNEFHFKEFVLAIRSAGFINSKLLSSKMTLDFAYALYLLLRDSGEIPKVEIKRYIQKWFVLSTITSRYISSAESQFDRDLREIQSKGFLQFFKENEESMLSETFWSVRLVRDLETSSINSPFFSTFIAAQVFLNDGSLLSSSSKVTDLVSIMGDIHHIFPKEYLKRNGVTDKSVYNQIANYTYLDTGTNISIGKREPNDYFTKALEQCSTKKIEVGTIFDENDLYINLSQNCIPQEVINMTAKDYQEFLMRRRRLMAKKISDYYQKL